MVTPVLAASVAAARAAIDDERDWRSDFAAVIREATDSDAGTSVMVWRRRPGGESDLSFRSSEGIEYDRAQLRADEQVAYQHPGVVQMVDPTAPPVHRVSDLLDLPRFRDTALYRNFHGYTGGRFPAGLRLLALPHVSVFVALHRTGADYSDAHLDLLAGAAEPLASALRFREQLRTASLRLGLADAAERLTTRERDVLALVARGWTNTRIGSSLGIGERTVRKHLDNARGKIGAGSRSAAAVWWARRSATV